MAGDERNWPSPDDEQRDHHESAGRCSERYTNRRRQRQLCIQQTVFYVTMVTCHHHFFKVEFIGYYVQENRIFLATRGVLWPKICRKCYSGRGSAPDPAGGAHDAPPDPLVGWGADTPPHTPPPLGAFGASIVVPHDTKSWRRHWSPPLFKVKLRQ